jgi:23S rRNA pseudouridine2605 synthase
MSGVDAGGNMMCDLGSLAHDCGRMKMILLVTAAVSKRAASYTNCILRPSAVGGGIHYSNSFQLRTLNSSHRYATKSDEHDDDDEERRKKVPSRKQRRRQTEELNLQRIDKLLAHRGVGTRSETFELAKSRRVAYATHPNALHEERTRIRGPKEKVPYNASLFLDGTLLPGPPPLLLVYHKPKYVLSTMEDDIKYKDQRRRHLGQILEDRYAKSGMHPVGRLDYDTTGLILFSLDGQLTQRLLHPRRGVEKEYVATVQGIVNEDKLTRQLSEGVTTTEGVHKAKLLSVSSSNGPQHADDGVELKDEKGGARTMLTEDDAINDGPRFDIDYMGPYSDVRLVVSEGKYRMVRRMLANCGHPVVELRRLRHGMIELGELPVGEFRQATNDEIEWAKSLMD